MLDADLTYDAAELPKFIDELEDGGDLVLGDRMEGIQPGAMPWLHQHVGNPMLTGLLNRLFGTDVRDAHCGMRAVRRDMPPSTRPADLRDGAGLRDGDPSGQGRARHPRSSRSSTTRAEGESKLSTWSDGWRHLRFLLIHSPKHLFLIPGVVMVTLGAMIMAIVLAQVSVLGRQWGIHAEIGGSLLLILGVQVLGARSLRDAPTACTS